MNVTRLKRVSTGIPELDKMTEGGFREATANLVAGRAGSGKTIFCFHFLMAGLKNGENVMYLTFEEDKEKLYDDLSVFGWDLEKYEREGKFVFLRYTPEQVKKVLTEGGGVIESIVIKHNIKRMVIDSISSFSLLYKDELSKKEAALSLFQMISNWGCTALLTAQDSQREEDNITSALEFEVDSIIFLYNVKIGTARKRAMEILKMRGTNHPQSIYRFDITTKGVSIHTEEAIAF